MTSQQYKFFIISLLLFIALAVSYFAYIQSTGNKPSVDDLKISFTEAPSHFQWQKGISPGLNARKFDNSYVLISNNSSPLSLCAEFPINLTGRLSVSFEAPTFEEIATANAILSTGGMFSPENCKPRYKVAIIVPYHQREKQLRAFLHHMHPILQRQLLSYGIFIIEQKGTARFNRALLMNIGYNESLQLSQWDCFVFHDVDLLVEDDRAPYSCGEGPRHMSGYIDKFQYNLPYETIFGGVSSIPRHHFEMVNGFSNLYFGWGGEDDDMRNRLENKKLRISRYSGQIMRYRMFRHDHESTNARNEKRFWLVKYAVDRMNYDGLNSLVYRRLDLQLLPTHTLVKVELDENKQTSTVFSSV